MGGMGRLFSPGDRRMHHTLSHPTLSGLPALIARLVQRRAPRPKVDAHVWVAECGTTLRLRTVRPQDAPLLGELFEDGLSPASRRLRFHTAVRSLSPLQLNWLASPDFLSHAAFIVTRQAGGLEHAVAEARWVRGGSASGAEFALSVADAWQHQGIGRRLLHALIDSARAHGLQGLVGDVLPANRAMQALAQCLHFDCVPHPDDDDLLCATLPLARHSQALLPVGWFH
jgi:acetyltransferase